MYSDKQHRDPKELQKNLQRNFDKTEDGKPVKFSIAMNKFIAGKDILILVSADAFYAKDTNYLSAQIRFLFDEIYSKHDSGRIIILNAGALYRHTKQMNKKKDAVDAEVIAEVDDITKNWRRLFFVGAGYGELQNNVKEMVEKGRLVYTELEDWTGELGVAQLDEESCDDLDKEIRRLRELSSRLEQNKKLFEAFPKNAELFGQYHQVILKEYKKENSNVRKAIDEWANVFYSNNCQLGDFKDWQEKAKEIIRTYCIEEAVAVGVCGHHVFQLAYPFNISSALSKSATKAWEAVADCLRKHRQLQGDEDKLQYLTLKVPHKQRFQEAEAEEAERIRAEAEETVRKVREEAEKQIAEARREAAQAKKALETVKDELSYHAGKLKLAKTAPSSMKARLEDEVLAGLDEAMKLASGSSTEENSSEEETKAGSPPDLALVQLGYRRSDSDEYKKGQAAAGAATVHGIFAKKPLMSSAPIVIKKSPRNNGSARPENQDQADGGYTDISPKSAETIKAATKNAAGGGDPTADASKMVLTH